MDDEDFIHADLLGNLLQFGLNGIDLSGINRSNLLIWRLFNATWAL